MKQPIIELLGQQYGRLTIVEDAGSTKKYLRLIKARCTCGVEKIILLCSLKNGSTTSCGCYLKERIKDTHFKHGEAGKGGLYSVWKGIKTRCYNPKVKQYSDYGGRGIGVCNEWKQNFLEFAVWCKENGWRKGLDIERINNNGDYSPLNCTFVTRSENCRNRRSNIIIQFNGESKTLIEWCELYKLKHNLVRMRLIRGWSVVDAFTLPEKTILSKHYV